MDKALLYFGTGGPQLPDREALIYENAEMAFARMATLERNPVGREDAAQRRPPPGLFDFIPHDPVIAMGLMAHIMLADFPKHSLLAGNQSLDEDADACDDIARLIWSCANTSRAVAVGDGAWRVLQMLPVTDRRHYDVPPLRHPRLHAVAEPKSLFIINHEADDRLARELAALAAGEQFSVTCCGVGEHPQDLGPLVTHRLWSPAAGIHIHVGQHAVSSNSFRLIDSWHCGRLALQLIPPRLATGWAASNLLIEDEANGFICHSANAVLAICKELQREPVLRRTLIAAGHRSAAPLTRAWSSIAADLLLA